MNVLGPKNDNDKMTSMGACMLGLIGLSTTKTTTRGPFEFELDLTFPVVSFVRKRLTGYAMLCKLWANKHIIVSRM